jgi:hypothetical protein
LRLCVSRNFARRLGRIARTAFPRWWGLAAPRTCAGGLLLRRQVGEHATESRRLSRSSFSVDLEGVGSGAAQSLLTVPRRTIPGAVASIGPCELRTRLVFLGLGLARSRSRSQATLQLFVVPLTLLGPLGLWSTRKVLSAAHGGRRRRSLRSTSRGAGGGGGGGPTPNTAPPAPPRPRLSPIRAPAAGPFPPQISPEGIARVPPTQLGPAPAVELPRGRLKNL